MERKPILLSQRSSDMTILISVIIGLFIGSVIGFSICFMLKRKSEYSGVMKVIREENNKLVYSLELLQDPVELEYMSEVIFKVETSDESS